MKNETKFLRIDWLAIILYSLFDRTLESIYVLQNNESFANLYTLCSKVASIIVLIILLTTPKIKYPNKKQLFLILLLLCYIVFITFFKEGTVNRAFMIAYPLVAYIALLLVKCRNIQKTKVFIHSISILYLGLAAINFIFMVISPSFFGKANNGDGAVYFFAKENGIVYPLLMGFIYSGLDYLFSGKMRKFIIYSTIFGLSILLSGSSTSVISTGCLFLFLFLPLLYKRIGKIGTLSLVSATFLFFFFIIFLGNITLFDNTFVSSFISRVFDKDLTFSGRTYIWAVALVEISRSPIWGHGLQDSTNVFYVYEKRFDKPDFVGTYSAHNQFMQLLYEGGVIAVFIFMAIIYVYCMYMKRYSNTALLTFFKCVIMSIMVLYMFEAVGFHAIIYVMVLASISIRYYKNSKFGDKRFI